MTNRLKFSTIRESEGRLVNTGFQRQKISGMGNWGCSDRPAPYYVFLPAEISYHQSRRPGDKTVHFKANSKGGSKG